tara:strand:+ start:559 stop:786 length:228 start_codon:yes stop_codon:yes gene_type:complete
MSSLRANKIVNGTDDGPVEFSKGLTIAANYPLASEKVVINSSGIVTATAYRGSGSQLTGLSGVTTKKAIALSFII